MTQPTKITCGLPLSCCRNNDEKETDLSCDLRIGAVAIGIIVGSVALIVLFNVPLNQIGTGFCWAAEGLGGILIVAGIGIKGVREESLEQKVNSKCQTRKKQNLDIESSQHESEAKRSPFSKKTAAKQKLLESGDSVVKALHSNIEASNNSEVNLPTTIIDLSNASLEIRSQVMKMWPKRTAIFANGSPEGDRIICMIQGNKLIGCAALEQINHEFPQSLVDAGSQKIYNLNIEISPEHQKKEYGRQLFDTACQTVLREGALLHFLDYGSSKIDENSYLDEKTCELFDVNYVIRGIRNEYFLKQKTQDSKVLNYLRINPEDIYIFWNSVETVDGLNHLVNYMKTYPDDLELLEKDISVLGHCQLTLDTYKNIWPKEELIKYETNLKELQKMHSSMH